MITLKETFSSIAGAIRDKSNTTSKITPTNMPQAIRNIPTSITLPTLNMLSLKREANSIIITNPSSNGSYATNYKLYSKDTFIKTISNTSRIDVRQQYTLGWHDITIRASNPHFNNSPVSNMISMGIFSVTPEVVDLTLDNSDRSITDGLSFKTKLLPIAGKFLPEFITVSENNNAKAFKYNSYTGEVTIDDVQGNLAIQATAWEVQKLRTPSIMIKNFSTIAEVERPKYALTVDVYLDDTLIKEETYQPPLYTVEDVPGAQYGFIEDADDYYQSNNYHRSGSYAYCKLSFKMTKPTGRLVLEAFSNGESNYDYGLISNLDQNLSLDTNTDQNIKHSFKGQSSTTPITITFDNIPQGEHYITLKYRKDSGGDQGLDRFKFKVVEL